MGGHYLISKDFEGPNKEDEEVREEMRNRRKKVLSGSFLQIQSRHSRRKQPLDIEGGPEKVSEMKEEKENNAEASIIPVQERKGEIIHRHVSFQPNQHHQPSSSTPAHTPNILSPATSVYDGDNVRLAQTATLVAPTECSEGPLSKPASSHSTSLSLPLPKRILKRALNILRSLMTPATISLLISFPISLIPTLKALFVPVPSSRIPFGPDGAPPLAFVLDTANFLGAASVPLGLLCLGAALAKMRLPNRIADLPLGAIGVVTIGRLVLMPILGLLIVEKGLVGGGIIHPDERVLRFVAM